MAAGQKIKGKDGIIELNRDAITEEVPCLTSWTLDSSASLTSDTTACMLSNGDGGSDADADWEEQTVESRAWSLSSEHLWQEDDTAGATGILDITDVGKIVAVKLYPNKKTVGKIEYSGSAVIESISVPSEVNGNVTQSVSYKGSGPLIKGVVAA